jgi:hypothetical protein
MVDQARNAGQLLRAAKDGDIPKAEKVWLTQLSPQPD